MHRLGETALRSLLDSVHATTRDQQGAEQIELYIALESASPDPPAALRC